MSLIKRASRFIRIGPGKKSPLAINYRFKTPSHMLKWHFGWIGEINHISREGISKVFELLEQKPVHILETGSSAWGVDSTRHWARYVENWGGRLDSVDIREEPRRILGHLGERVYLHRDDSLKFLEKLGRDNDFKYDFVYLDSFDVDWANPLPAAIHGLSEFKAILELTHENSLVLIDDTPSKISDIPYIFQREAALFLEQHGVLPGKGAFILNSKEIRNFEIIHHGYNLLLRKLVQSQSITS